MRLKRYAFFPFLLIAVLFLNSGQSFTLLGSKWPKNTFRYYINPRNKDVNEDQVVKAIKQGAAAWRPWCRANYVGTTDRKRIKNDAINRIFFRSDEYGALASTYVFNRDNEILDVDIVFWDNPWKFYGATEDCEGGFFLRDVATHEFGHAIGIGHTRKKSASMFPHCGYCNNAVRSLEPDDTAAANRLYGTVAVTSLVIQQ